MKFPNRRKPLPGTGGIDPNYMPLPPEVAAKLVPIGVAPPVSMEEMREKGNIVNRPFRPDQIGGPIRKTLELQHGLFGPATAPAQSESARLSALLRQDYAPQQPAVPDYPPARGFGYHIPILPEDEARRRQMTQFLGQPQTPEEKKAALMKSLVSKALAERERSMPRESNTETRDTDELPDRNVRNIQQASWFGEDEEEKQIREEFEALQKNTDPKMIVRMEANRVWAIRNNRRVIFNIEDNPSHTGEAPVHRVHETGYHAVKDHDDIIVREARRFGVDPDLVRSIMYVENADGFRGGFDQAAEKFRWADTILPMNIDATIWNGMAGVSTAEFADPEKNIRAGVALIKEIQDRVVDPTPAKIGSIWQFSGAEKVRENGAKIERVMRERLWEKLPEEGMPGPHVP